MKIIIPSFRGTLPRLSDKLLPDNNATLAQNCNLQSGEVRAYRAPEKKTDLPQFSGQDTKSIYRWWSGSHDYWLQFPSHVDLVRSPTAEDVWQRIYWTGDSRFNVPMMSYSPAIYTGGSNLPATAYRLGIDAPASGPTVAVDPLKTGTVSAVHKERPIRVQTVDDHGLKSGDVVRFDITDINSADNLLSDYMNGNDFQITVTGDKEYTLNNTDAFNVSYNDFNSGTWSEYIPPGMVVTRSYVFTYVSEINEEGPPSDPSEAFEIGYEQGCVVTIPAMGPGIGANRVIDKIRIYRIATGSGSGQFQFVDEVPVSTTTYNDTKSPIELGESLESTEYDPPPSDMKGIKVTAQGFGVGFSKNRICFSEPYLLHAWPTSYQLALDYDIVSIELIDNGVVVGTTGRPYIIQGIDPRSMSPRRLEVNYACVSARSMTTLGYAVVYASTAGLVMVDRGGARLITERLITEEEWAVIEPSTLHGYELDGKYLGFYGTSYQAIVFDPRDSELGLTEVSIPFPVVHAFYDSRDPFIYLLRDDGGGESSVWRWNDTSGDKSAWSWHSKVFASHVPINIAAGRVDARIGAGESVSMTLLCDGEVIHSHIVTSSDPFWLPAGYLARDIQVAMTGTGDLCRVELAESMEELDR